MKSGQMNGGPTRSVLDLVRDLCLLRRGPQDLPHSTNLLIATVIVALALDIAIATRFQPFASAFPRVLLSTSILLAMPYFALKLANLGERYVQTVTALIATSAVFTLLTVPIVIGVGKLPQDPKDLTAVQAMFGWISLVLVAWQLAVRGHILRHALNLPMRLGVLVAVVFFAIEMLAALLLFGRETA